MPRLFSKYLATKIMPGVVLRPTPIPVKIPKVKNSVSMLVAELLLEMPMKHSNEPPKVTFLQLNRWHKALVSGAMANASVVIHAGIQAANVTDDSAMHTNDWYSCDNYLLIINN